MAPRTETREQSQSQLKGCHYCMEGSQAALGHTVSTQYVLMILLILTRLESPTWEASCPVSFMLFISELFGIRDANCHCRYSDPWFWWQSIQLLSPASW